jgi:hypothetical protein
VSPTNFFNWTFSKAHPACSLRQRSNLIYGNISITTPYSREQATQGTRADFMNRAFYLGVGYPEGARGDEGSKLAPEPTVSISSDLPSTLSTLPSASLKSLDQSAGAPRHLLPRSSIGSHKQPLSTTVEKNRVARDPISQSNNEKAVRSGNWYWLSTRSNCVWEIRLQASR